MKLSENICFGSTIISQVIKTKQYWQQKYASVNKIYLVFTWVFGENFVNRVNPDDPEFFLELAKGVTLVEIGNLKEKEINKGGSLNGLHRLKKY
jgi:hypothetical protein